MKTTGYSATPLAKKLGIKNGYVIKLVNEPSYFLKLFDNLPEVKVVKDKKTLKNFVHYFTKELGLLSKDLPLLKNEIVPDGMIWVSWPKKTSKVETDVTEALVRKIALEEGLVDIKVCAVDEVWSGLK